MWVRIGPPQLYSSVDRKHCVHYGHDGIPSTTTAKTPTLPVPCYETNVYYQDETKSKRSRGSGSYSPIFIDASDVDLLGGPEHFAVAVKSMTFKEWEADKPEQITPWREAAELIWMRQDSKTLQ